MGKTVADAVLDGALAVIATATQMIVCTSDEPTTYAQATATYALANVAMSSDDYTIANGDTNGRKITMAQKASVSVDTSGTAGHVALVSSGDSALLYVTTCAAQVLSTGNTVTFPAWDVEIADPT